jgi:hypothetical protein
VSPPARGSFSPRTAAGWQRPGTRNPRCWSGTWPAW